MYLKEMDRAKDCLNQAIGFHRHEQSYIMLGKCHLMESDLRKAIDVYEAAVQ